MERPFNSDDFIDCLKSFIDFLYFFLALRNSSLLVKLFCSFTNKNYINELGGCNNNGYCGIPIGIKQQGYNTDISMINDIDKAECYNCDKMIDKNCCKEQLDNTNMNSPDYAFKNDRTTRLMDKMNLMIKDLKV